MEKIKVVKKSAINNQISIEENFVNPANVASIEPNNSMKRIISESDNVNDSMKSESFSDVVISAGNESQRLTVVGSPEILREKLSTPDKGMLYG